MGDSVKNTAPATHHSNQHNNDFGNFDPFGASSSAPAAPAQKRPSGNNFGNFDAFGASPAPAAATTAQKRPSATGFDAFGAGPAQSQGFDAFGPSSGAGNTAGGFDAFSGSSSSAGFDAFGSPAPSRYPPNQQQQQQGFGGGFSNFGSPPPQQPQAPMPFIRLAPPAPAPEPVAPPAAAAPAAGEKAPKNFSAFDELLAPATSAPLPSLTAPAQVIYFALGVVYITVEGSQLFFDANKTKFFSFLLF